MKIILDASVFEGAVATATIMGFVGYALQGKHRLHVVDESDPGLLQWLGQRSQEDREEWRSAIDFSLQLDALEPANRAMVVSQGNNSDWSMMPPRLVIQDALDLLARPYRVYVEHAVNDRAFLMAVSSDEQRAALRSAERSGTLEFSNGGGISTLRQMLVAATGNPIDKFRTAALFDSDALSPQAPSQQSEDVRRYCVEQGLWHHQLQRRAIENYIVLKALHWWAFNGGNAAKREIFLAFARLSRDQRDHYNMKQGFARDAKRQGPDAGGVYMTVTKADKIALANGFSSSLSDLFSSFSFEEKHLRAEGVWIEVNPVVSEIIAKVR